MSWAALGVIGLRKTTYVARNEKKTKKAKNSGKTQKFLFRQLRADEGCEERKYTGWDRWGSDYYIIPF